MAGFEKKTWIKREVEHPGRRRLEPAGEDGIFDVTREEGQVVKAGDAFSPENMNDLEERILTALLAKLDVTGTLPVANGGTGQTTLALARNAMGLGNTTGYLPLANGGTGRNNGIAAANVLAGAFAAGAYSIPLINHPAGASLAMRSMWIVSSVGTDVATAGTLWYRQ